MQASMRSGTHNEKTHPPLGAGIANTFNEKSAERVSEVVLLFLNQIKQLCPFIYHGHRMRCAPKKQSLLLT